MTNVIIHGRLGKIFGQNHRFKVRRMSEIVHAINANSPGFKQAILSNLKEGSDYCYVDPKNPNKKYKRPEEFLNSKPPEELHLVPVILGAGGIGEIIAGLILIAASNAPIIAGYAKLATALFYIGVSMIINGVISILFPIETPSVADQGIESKIDTASYIFSSLRNNAVQGFPIPLLYGELRVGSNIISTNVVSEDMSSDGTEISDSAGAGSASSVGGSASGGGTSGGTTVTIDTDGDGVGDTQIQVEGSDAGAAGGGQGVDLSDVDMSS